MNIFSQHLSFEQLTDAVEEQTPEQERQAMNSHLAACSSCATELTRIQAVVGLMRSDLERDAPADLIAATVAQFRARRLPKTAPEETLVRRLIAALSFDSLSMSPAYGVRSSEATQSVRQMLFNAGDLDVDLRVSFVGEHWVVAGQVLGECEGGQVKLSGDAESFVSDLTELCQFTLPAVAGGDYRLQLRLPGIVVEIPTLKLGE